MANIHTTLSGLLTNIANAIRSKNGSTQPIIADNFPTEIENLRTGFDYNNQNVTSIADYEFKNCTDIRSVDCYNLTSIGTGAFEGCSNLKSVILWDSIESVGDNAFKGCSDDLVIYCMFDVQPSTWNANWNPDGCEVVWCCEPIEIWDISLNTSDSVTATLYNNVGVKEEYSLVIGGSVHMKNYDSSFLLPPWSSSYKNNITSVTIQDGVTNIGNCAFYNCASLTSITIPDSVTSIGSDAFFDTPWLTVRQQENPLVVVNNILIDGKTCSGDVIILDSVTSIGSGAFYRCTKLTSINIPDSVTSIGHNAFQYCSGLTSITIPDSITSIGANTFYSCFILTSITYTGTIEQWNAISKSSSWNDRTDNYTIHCTDGDIAKDGTITYHTTE